MTLVTGWLPGEDERHDPVDSYGRVVGWTDLPHTGDELHHFGWNACSSALCPAAPHPHVERSYLIVPGLRSSRIYVLDTKDDPRAPRVVKEIPAEELAAKAGYSRPHTIHCGPDGIYVSALGNGHVGTSAISTR
uniref:selenium-binding protein SBP56-related protein n=1 Tax=Paractinoplanes polyasparticus TaxID=2856853 RepID=UPI0027DECEDF|nr:selenium-binding protein SBP56-related protein [Actinoplanes polyasparticus]